MSKNIYFFGDSFSNFIPNDTEYLKTLPTKFLHWTNQISTHLNIDTNDIIDLSRSGMSTQEIFDKCLSTSNKIKKGDWVIISDSPTIRQIGYDKRYKEIKTYNNETLFWRWETDGTQLRKQMNNYDNHITTYIDYLSYFIKPNEDTWEEYYRNQIINLLTLLKQKGINCIFWSWQLWNNEVFTPWSKEWKRADNHWGYNGNNEFSEYLKKRIDKKEMVSEVEWKNPKSLVKKLL
jgi:hypothetical protein